MNGIIGENEMSRGKFSDPAAVVMLFMGEIIARADDAVCDFDDKAVSELDDILQDIAHYVRESAEKSRKVERIPLEYEDASPRQSNPS